MDDNNQMVSEGSPKRLNGTQAQGARFERRGLLRVCRACLTVWRCKSSPNLMEVKGSEAQRRHREVGSEGRAEQNRDLTYRNRIGGLTGRASRHEATKPISIKGPWGKSGRCAGKAVKLNSRDLPRVRQSRTEGAARLPDRVAEVSRGRSTGVGAARETLVRKERNGRCEPNP